MLSILSVGGSDPSSGAGIQGDIKACESLGAYCLTAVTGITSQNTTGFGTVEPVSTRILKEQLEMVFSDFEVSAIKIGMVYSPGIIKTVFDAVRERDVPVVLDPVIRSTTGGMLIQRRGIRDLKRRLVPISTIVTPNKFEAELLTGCKIGSRRSVEEAAQKLAGMGAKNVVITGLEVKRDQITDYVLAGGRGHYLSQKKKSGVSHGGGCNYSLAICYAVADKKPIKNAARFSMQFTHDSIRNSKKIGGGVHLVRPAGNGDKIYGELSRGIDELGKIRDVYKIIPECQTNFVFSKSRPASRKDVLGVEGRIVRSGKSVVVAGELRYGGSKHVASAVLAVSKKFPLVRAAVNIRFQENAISRLKKARMVVLCYDRAAEPDGVRKTEGASVAWGIRTAIKNSASPPDAVFHRGGFGKEPMIIIFGRDPAEITGKLQRAFA